MNRRPAWSLILGCGLLLLIEGPSTVGSLWGDLEGPYARWGTAPALELASPTNRGVRTPDLIGALDAEPLRSDASVTLALSGVGDARLADPERVSFESILALHTPRR